MSFCASCKTENPPGSKFCAGCGAALPKTPVNMPCVSCGVESPEGSRFCKGCGKALGASPPPTPQSPGWGRAQTAGPGAPAVSQSQTLQRAKMLLGVGAGLYAVAIFLMYSQLAQIRSAFGIYASQVPGVGLNWLLIILDAGLAAGNLYAISLVGKGQYKYAKWLFLTMAVLGGIFLLRNLSGPVIFILLNAGLLAAGVWGNRLLSRQEKGLAA